MADGAYTQEYRALKRLVPELRIAVQRNIVTLSGILLSKALISSEVDSLLRDELSRSKESRAAELVSIILDKVKINRENFTIFIDILKACGDHYSDLVKLIESEMNKTDNQTTCGHPARPDDGRLADPAQSSGTQSPGTQSPGIQSPGTQSHHAHEVASQCFICTNKLGCPEPLEKISFPYLDPSNVVQLDDREKRDLEFRLERETEHMILLFQGLVFQLYKTIDMGKKVSINELKFLLKGIKALPNRSEKSLFEEYSDKLSAASSILCIFEVITQFCSFIDYSIVEYLINHLGSDSDKERMKNYQTEFNEYAKRRIIECPVSIKPADNSRWSITHIKMDSKLENLTIKQFLEFRFKVGKILNMDVAAIHFCCAHSGCIQFTCQIPLFVTKAVFPISSDQAMSLKQLGVIWFSCAGYEYSAQEMTLQLSSCAKDKDTVKDQLESALITSMETEPPTKRIKLGEEPERESAVSIPWTPTADPFPQSSAALQCLQSAVQDTTPGLRANVQGPYQGVGSSFSPSAYSSTPRPHHHPLMQRFTIPGEGTSGSNMPQRTVSIHNISMPLQPVFTSPPAWTVGRAKQSSQYDDQSFILHGLGEGTSDGNTSQTTVSVHNLSMPLQPVVFTSPQLGGAEQQSDRELATTTPANMLRATSSIFQGCSASSPAISEAYNMAMTYHSHMQAGMSVDETAHELFTNMPTEVFNSGQNTAEYQTIKKCTPQLKIATQHTLTKLSGHLLSSGLITADQDCELRNIMHPESDRAAKLISLILNKVELAPKYYSVFINALEEDKLNNEVVLKHLEETYSTLTSGGLMRNSVSTELFRVSAMAKLNEYLILTQSQVSTKKFPNLPNKKFIALAVIEKEYVNRENADAFTKGTLHGHPDEILKKKEPIILEAVLEPPEGQRNVKLVFVEGAPGVGKSTLALELCRRQKEIKAMAKYSLVLLFQLRDKDVQGIQMIEGLFHHDDISLQRSVTKEVIDCNGKDVLFILDGFDELPSNLRQDSFFVKLIQGKHLPASTVLVTSRPSASAEILQSVNDYKYIEVLGFTQNQVEQYARSMLNDQPDVLKDFLKYIFVNPAIRGMMYVPLNSAIVLHIYRKNRTKSKTFPRTMTQLYTELCLVLLIKYLKEKNESDPLITDLLNTTDLGDLPESIKDQIFMLGELAFKGALSQEITFERLPKGCDDLGLLNVSTGLYLGRKSYSFLHLTLQEFLAGYYFSHLSPVEQELKFVNNLMLNDIRSKSGIKLGNHLNVMWRFVAGLNGFKNIGWGLVYDASNWCRTDYDRKDMRCTPFLIRCLFEVQDVKEIKSACDSIFVTSECPNINLCFSNHLDCYAAGYCIAVSGQKWNLNLSYIEGDEVLEMLCCGLKSAVNISGSILDLDLAGNSLTAAAMSYLRELQTIGILPQIHLLSLRGNKLNNCAFDDFAEIVTSMVNLTCLQVGDNLVEESGMVKFFQNLSQISTLTELHMADINLGFTDIQALSEMMASIKYLTKLSIGDPRMSDKSVIEMVKVLLSPTSLKEVTFRGVFWTCKRAENFALLKQNNNIATLTFERNYDYSFHLDPVIPAIAEALHVNKSLQVLKMPPRYSHDDAEEDVHIRHESIVALSTMLRVNKTLKRLDIFASLACDDIAFLSDALRFNYTLQTLNVSNKRINISHYSDSDED